MPPPLLGLALQLLPPLTLPAAVRLGVKVRLEEAEGLVEGAREGVPPGALPVAAHPMEAVAAACREELGDTLTTMLLLTLPVLLPLRLGEVVPVSVLVLQASLLGEALVEGQLETVKPLLVGMVLRVEL